MGLRRSWLGFVLCAGALNGCQSAPLARASARPCNGAAFDNAAVLPLPPAAQPSPAPVEKSGPLRFANSVPVNGGIGDIGAWEVSGAGWTAWRLRLTSEGAKSLSVHVRPLALPAAAELWLCSPDGKVRHGPFRGNGPNGDGQFWSPAVPGPELWMEVRAPADTAPETRLRIATAFIGFR